MSLKTAVVSTREIPLTVSILEQSLPKVLRSTCFNEDNIPFHIEVISTEIGHLFEHILLEYLCEGKIARGFHLASFRGETHWNWQKEQRGTFHIGVNSGLKDHDSIDEAVTKTVGLVTVIMRSSFSPPVTIKSVSIPVIPSQGGISQL